MNSVIAKTGFDAWTGQLVRRLRRKYNDQCITILTYHSVSRKESIFTAGTNLRHHPREFERQIEYLSDQYNLMSLRDLAAALGRSEQPRRAVVLTFDDGYADSIRLALPILLRRRIPMTLFPVASVIGNRDLLWQHKLAWLIASGHEALVWDALRAEGWNVVGECGPLAEYVRRNYRSKLPSVLETLLNAVGASGAALAAEHRPYIEAEQIAEADPEFVEFGNHTDTHPVLSALTIREQNAEITVAQRKLRELTGRPPLAFAYPFGLKPHYTEDTARLVRDTGHHTALDMRRRMNVGGVDPFELSRKPAIRGPQSEFEKTIEDWPANALMAPPGDAQGRDGD